jgi:hypothetical protein
MYGICKEHRFLCAILVRLGYALLYSYGTIEMTKKHTEHYEKIQRSPECVQKIAFMFN